MASVTNTYIDKAQGKILGKTTSGKSTDGSTKSGNDDLRSATGKNSVVNGAISQISNPYFAFITIELYNDTDSDTIIINQNEGFLSMEHQRLYKGLSQVTLTLFDRSGDYDLERKLLKFNNIKLQYGYSDGSVSPLYNFQVQTFTPTLDAGYSKVEIKAMNLAMVDNLQSNAVKSYKGTDSKGTVVSEIVKEVAGEVGWVIGNIEETTPIKDDRGVAKSFLRSGMTALDFISYELAPLAVSAKTGAGGYVVILDSADTGDVTNGGPSLTRINFIPHTFKSSKSTGDNVQYVFDVRTPSGASLNKVIRFSPTINTQLSGASMQASVVSMSSTGTIEGVAKESDASEKLEPTTTQKSGKYNVVKSSASADEVQAQAQATKDYTFPTTFRAEMEVMGNPYIKVLDLIEVNYIMMNGNLHHSSGQYTVSGVIDNITGGSFVTTIQLIRGTDIDSYYTTETSEYSSFDEGSYAAPEGGYKISSPVGSHSPAMIQKFVNFFVANGMTPKGAAYMTGNILQESGGNPGCVTNEWFGGDGMPPGGGMDDAVGLCQWHRDRRYKYGLSIPTNPSTWDGQCKFILKELQTSKPYAMAWKRLSDPYNNDEDSYRRALKEYTGYGIEGKRVEYAKAIFQQIKSQSVSLKSPGSTIMGGFTTGGGRQFETSFDMGNKTKVILSLPSTATKIVYPVGIEKSNWVITSPWGYRNIPNGSKNHNGIDFRAPTGSPIVAFTSGTVQALNNACNNLAGRWVKIDHSGGITASYCHLSEITSGLSVGQKLAAGQVLGKSGGSGNVDNQYAPHLHLTVRYNGSPFNAQALFYPLATSGKLGSANWKLL